MNKLFKPWFILFSTLNISVVSAQFKLTGIVLDSESREALPFASIFNLSTGKGLYSTEKGKFNILVNNNDSIAFSCVGYEKKYCQVIISNKNVDTFLLARDTKVLSEVTITKINWENYKERKVGYTNFKSNWHIGGSTGSEYAVYIPNAKKKPGAYIFEINCGITKFRKDTVAIRLHVYSVNANGMPGEEFLDAGNIEFLSGVVEKTFSFDISASKVLFPREGVFLGIEYLGKYNLLLNNEFSGKPTEPLLDFTNKIDSLVTFSRSHNEEWKKSDVRLFYVGSELEKQVFQRNAPNLAIGALIKEPK